MGKASAATVVLEDPFNVHIYCVSIPTNALVNDGGPYNLAAFHLVRPPLRDPSLFCKVALPPVVS